MRHYFLVFLFFWGAALPILARESTSTGSYPFEKNFISLLKNLRFSVVAISPIKTTKIKKDETFRERYYRLQREKILGISKGQVGSATLLDQQGHLITSLEVIPSQAKEMEVTFANGRRFQARVIHRFPREGFGILKLPKPYGKPILLGNSSGVKLGQISVTAGNPYNSIGQVGQIAISLGRITGKYEVSDKHYKGVVLETDSAISQGSFGGPLVDKEGRMIGLVIPSYSTVRWTGVALPLKKILQKLSWNHLKIAELSNLSLDKFEKAFFKAFHLAAPYVVSLEYSYPQKPLTLPLPFFHSRKSSGDPYYTRPRSPCSAVVVEKGGYLLTSAFNLSGQKDRITVVAHQGNRYPAKVLALHQELDLALLKIEEDLPAIPLGKSEGALLGQWLCLVGRPWPDTREGEAYTLNTGILSSLHRFRDQAYQTDGRMNFGNLGGAVVDLEGNLMGISVRLSPRTGNSSGVGFFIPTHKLKKIIPELKKGKDLPPFTKGYLGIQMDDVTNSILQIIPGSPAQKAPLQVDDLVVEVEGKKVSHKFDLMIHLIGYSAGREVKIKVKRGSQTLEFKLQLNELKSVRNKREIQ